MTTDQRHQYDKLEAERDIARIRVARLERAIKKALEHNVKGEVAPLTIRHILMDGLKGQ